MCYLSSWACCWCGAKEHTFLVSSVLSTQTFVITEIISVLLLQTSPSWPRRPQLTHHISSPSLWSLSKWNNVHAGKVLTLFNNKQLKSNLKAWDSSQGIAVRMQWKAVEVQCSWIPHSIAYDFKSSAPNTDIIIFRKGAKVECRVDQKQNTSAALVYSNHRSGWSEGGGGRILFLVYPTLLPHPFHDFCSNDQ